MFAIAAFAMMGLTSAPVFAASDSDNFHNISVPANGNDFTDDDSPEDNECASGESNYTNVRVANEDPDDIIRVETDAEDCSNYSSTKVLIRVQGNTVYNQTFSDDYRVILYGGSIVQNDDVDITVIYYF